MPVLMPMFDRVSCSIPKSQIGFVDYIINDMIEAWDGETFFSSTFYRLFSLFYHRSSSIIPLFAAFIDMPEMVTHMRQNYDKWKEYQVSCCLFLPELKYFAIIFSIILFSSLGTRHLDSG